MTFVFFVDLLFLDRHIPPLCGIVGGIENQPQPHERREFIMTKKRKIGLVIGAAAACIAVLCAAGACNGTAKEERIAYRVIVTTTMTAVTSQPTEISTTATPTMTAPVTTTVETTTEPQITTTVTCSATETTTATTEQTIAKMQQMKNADQSDICTLNGFLYMVRIVQNPVQNGQRYYLDVMQNYEKALKLNPNNQLAQQLQQKFLEGMKQQTGM